MMKPGSNPRLTISLCLAGVLLSLLYLAFQRGYLPKSASDSLSVSPASTLESFASYRWSYQSEASFQGNAEAPTLVICNAAGVWQIEGAQNQSRLHIEYFRCNETDLAIETSYHFPTAVFQAGGQGAAIQASPINALALALVHEIDLGVSLIPMSDGKLVYNEERLQGPIERSVSFAAGSDARWIKSFDGFLPSQTGIKRKLRAETKGHSRLGEETLKALIDLQTEEHEETIAADKVVAVSKISIEIKEEPGTGRITEAGAALPLASVPQDPERERKSLWDEWNRLILSSTAPPGSTPIALPSKSDLDPFYARLKHAFRRDPHFSQEFRHALDPLPPESEAFKLLLGALAYAGSEEATRILSESARAKIGDENWQRAMAPVFGLISKPTAESWDYLADLRKDAGDPDVRKAAELAMAGEVHKGLKTDRSAEFVKAMLEEEATNADSIFRILDMIGNAGLEEALPRVATWAQNSDPRVRAASAESLRLMKSAESEELLLQLLGDAAMDVRRSSAQALNLRTLSARALAPLLEAKARPENKDAIVQSLLAESLYQARHQQTQNPFDSERDEQ